MKNLVLSSTFMLIFVALALHTFSQVPDYVPTEGLVAWYPFNGNADDESGNGNHGQLNGPALTEDRNGVINQAYSFDGEDDYILVPHVPMLDFSADQTLTLSYWYATEAQPTSNQEFQLFMKVQGGGSSTMGFQVVNFNNGNVSLRAKNGTGTDWIVSSCGPISPNNEFVHVVHVLQPDTAKCYLNGELVFNTTHDDVFGYNEEDLIIGWNNYFTNFNSIALNGKLDDIGLWNRALTNFEVMALYNASPIPPSCFDPCINNHAQGDLDCDGSVGTNDLLLLLSNFGLSFE